MNPKAKELQTEQENIARQIEQLEHRNALLENRIDYLDQGERKRRTHRLVTRGAAVESIIPAVKSMTEPEFYELMETILRHPSIVPLLPTDDS